MCRLLVIPGINNDNRSDTLKLIEKMSVNMSELNRDGLGYAGLTSKGELFGERWFNNGDAFLKRKEPENETVSLLDQFGDILTEVETMKEGYNSFGLGKEGLNDVSAITMHTRMATTGRDFINTHPFITEDGMTTLIHNGIINNHDKLHKRYSTCDSETILGLYEKGGVFDDFKLLEPSVIKKVYGYYAVAVLSGTSDGKRVLDVFKADAFLYGAWIKELGTYALTTKAEDLDKACFDLGLTMTRKYKVSDDRGVRINPYTGEVLEKLSFVSNPRTEPYVSTYSKDYSAYESERFSKKSSTEESGSATPGESTQKGGDSSSKETPSDVTLEQAYENPQLVKKYVNGLSDAELIVHCNSFFERHADSNHAYRGTVDANELLKRLRSIKKEAKLNKIIDSLCGDPYHWTEYFEKDTQEWYFKRSGSSQ